LFEGTPRAVPDKFNKSCRVFLQESNKIEFAFFLIFYNFLCILQVSAKHIYYLRNRLSLRSLEISTLLQICPRFTLKTLERLQTLQCAPWPWPAARVAEFRLTPANSGSAVGRARAGTACGSPRLGFRARRVRDHNRRGGKVAALWTGRWSTRSGEGAAWLGRHASRGVEWVLGRVPK
jgi:hypothetical protein